MQIDPWSSNKLEKYAHIFKEFGLNEFKFEFNHYLFSRGIVVAERDFKKIYSAINNKKTFLQLTGIASSGNLHLGHKLDVDFFLFFRNLGAKSLFVVSDIDAYLSRPDSKINNLNKAKEFAVENIADLLALGLKPEEIYVQSNKSNDYYSFAFSISKKITESMFQAIYGHINPAKMSAVLLQLADILHVQKLFGAYPTLTGIGLEQDPHARLTRDVARHLKGFETPSFFYFKHQSGLKQDSKMSSSNPDTAIFLNDSPSTVKKKISRSFTGGRDTVEEQKRLGGNPDVCKVFEIFKFHHPDNEFVKDIDSKCRAGKLMCGECKKLCVDFLNDFLKSHQEKHKEFLPLAKSIVFKKPY